MEFEFKDMTCKCGSNKFVTMKKRSQTGLYCSSCGKWIKWLSKDEKNLIKLKLNSIYGAK